MRTPEIEFEPRVVAAPIETVQPASNVRSFLESYGLTALDAVATAVAASMVVLLLPAGLSNWASRIAVLVALVPLGSLFLVRSIRDRDRAAVLLALVIVAAAASSALSDAPWTAFIGSFKHQSSFLIYLGAACAWAIGTRVSSRGQVAIGWGVVGASALSGFFAVLELIAKPAPGAWALTDGRPPGLAVHPVYFGAFAAGCAAWFAYRLIDRVTLPDLAGLAFSSAFATLSGSRVALLAVVLLTIVAVARAERWRAWPGLLAVAVGATGATAFHRALGSSQSSLDRGATSGLDDRLHLWPYGLRGWTEHPLLGWGPGRFGTAISGHLDDAWILRFSNAWADAHNVGLEWLVTMGVVGLVLGAAFMIVACVRARGPLAWMAGAIAFGWLLEPTTAGTLGLAALLLGASCGTPRRSLESAPANPRRERRFELAACGLGLLLGAWYLANDLTVDVTAPTVTTDATLHWWYSHDPEVASMISDGFGIRAVGRPGGSPEAVEWAREAVAREPDSPIWRAALAARLLHTGDVDGARVAAEEALRRQDNNVIALYVLLYAGQQSGDDELMARATTALCEIGSCPEDVLTQSPEDV